MLSKNLLIVGLGNPDKEYQGSRHNCGADYVNFLSDKIKITLSKEDKFFGVKTEISTDKPEVEVEVVDDTPQEDRRPPKQETAEEPVDDETLDKEISDYSERAGKRISKIKYEYHEERRAKEAALRENTEAVNRLKTMMAENERLKRV